MKGCVKHKISFCKVCKKTRSISWRKNNPERKAWWALKDRCLNSKNKQFARYGGRGISVCERWLDFNNFYIDVGKRPSKGYTIERVNNEGNYEPKNVIWTTFKNNERNKSTTRLLTFMNKTYCLTEWAERLGIYPNTLRNRLLRFNWSVERALSTPVKLYRKRASWGSIERVALD